MAHITVTLKERGVYQVIVDDAASRTTHDVTVTADDIDRYAPGATAERLVEASFRFLLEREPQESILSRFALPVIEQYFPDCPAKIHMRMAD